MGGTFSAYEGDTVDVLNKEGKRVSATFLRAQAWCEKEGNVGIVYHDTLTSAKLNIADRHSNKEYICHDVSKDRVKEPNADAMVCRSRHREVKAKAELDDAKAQILKANRKAKAARAEIAELKLKLAAMRMELTEAK